MPTKEFDPASGKYRVQFRLPPEAGVQQAWLAGEFNEWSTDDCQLDKQPDGALTVTMDLDPGCSYRFRYYLGDGDWENDWAADAYVDNVHGGADSVVTVPAAPGSDSGPPPVAAPGSPVPPSPAAAVKKAAKKKAAAKKAAAKKKAPAKKAAKKRPPAP